ncbi:MAG: 4Fe-4S binding protein [Anaerolineales bacterium]|nr:4Fe-4S binding protein [Anaerolineales bacterium]
MSENPYKRLAERLDALPNGYPSTEDGAELRLLAWLFTPEEAALGAQLRITLETHTQIAERIGRDPRETRLMLKDMARKGLIKAGRADSGRGLGYGLLPFAIGIYEYQFNTIDAEMAQLFEDYYHQAFGQMLTIRPFVHRVVPIGQTVRNDMQVRPYESATEIVNNARAWGVVDCLCRQQQALIGNPCDHPLDVCMVVSETPGQFDGSDEVKALTREGAMATLLRAAEAGLVHSVSNNQEGLWYICNCCTCACGVLRAMADLGIANVIAKSAFVVQVEEERCIGCGQCVDMCQFDALDLLDVIHLEPVRCVGCGVCVITCPEDALVMVRRPEEEIEIPAVTEAEWGEIRAQERGLDLTPIR